MGNLSSLLTSYNRDPLVGCNLSVYQLRESLQIKNKNIEGQGIALLNSP